MGGAIRSSIDDLAGWAQVERPALVRLAGADGRVAIFFSDIEGSTELNERLGDKDWVRLLARHDAVVRSAIDRQEGQVVKTQGDGFMAAFASPEHAVRSAISIQQAFDRGRRKDPAAVLVRIGIHYGDVVHRDNDIFGRNVAHAARVAALATGGEILVSESVAETLGDCEDISVAEPREVQLKGLAGDHYVAAVDWPRLSEVSEPGDPAVGGRATTRPRCCGPRSTSSTARGTTPPASATSPTSSA